ncbi:MAG: hypothetical protein ABIJ12_00615 [bacterium]
MSQKEQIAEALLTELQKDLPLMDVPGIKVEMMEWLKQLPLPKGTKAEDWDQLIREFPSSNNEKELYEGFRIRLSLKVNTTSNHYIISIIESLTPSSRNKYIIAVYSGWKKDEWVLQKQIEEKYKGRFDDIISPKNIIWVQNFEAGGLHEALTSCAIAILGHELCEGNEKSKITPISHPLPSNFTYPEKSEIEE